jgi:cob(I)alamin adenosyltransferase
MYDNSVKENLEKENYIKEYKQLQEIFAAQQNQLFNLSEEVKNKENNAKFISEEITNIKNFLKEKDNYIGKITKKLRIQKQINEKKTKEIKVVDVNGIKAKIIECENRIPDLQSELSSYKKDSE